MFRSKHLWWLGAGITLALIAVVIFACGATAKRSSRRSVEISAQASRPHGSHSHRLATEFASGEEVTHACLECHPDSSTSSWRPVTGHGSMVPTISRGADEPVLTGKKYVINNFCIGITPNWPPCTACHAGYGWEDETFDFTDESKVDCLVCHDTTGTYVKQNAGYPAESVDLAHVAQNVGLVDRDNCGGCHFTAAAATQSSMVTWILRSPIPDEIWTYTWASTTLSASTAIARRRTRSPGGRSRSAWTTRTRSLHRLSHRACATRMNGSTVTCRRTSPARPATSRIRAQEGHEGRMGLVGGGTGLSAESA